jgi:hypothetical protein
LILGLRYGDVDARLNVELRDDRTVLFRASAEGTLPDGSELALHLPGRCGDRFVGKAGEQPLDGASLFSRYLPGEPCRVCPLAFEWNRDWRVEWPHHPAAVYNLPLRLPLDNAVVRLSARLNDGPVELGMKVTLPPC